MDEDTLDRLVASTGTVAEADVAHLDLAAAEADLLEAIMSTHAIDRPSFAATARRRPRRVATVLSIAAVVAVIVGVVGYRGAQPGGDSAFSAELIALAHAAPRLLVDAPGWSVSRADELS